VSELVLTRLKERFGTAIIETHSHCGDDTAVVEPSHWRDACAFLREHSDLDFDLPVDLCAVDYPGRLPRVEVVLHLYSIAKRHRVRLKARVGDEELNGLELDSAVSVWAGLNWLERETWDMSGVRFRGHPDLRRILMYPEFEGHPLQRTYPAYLTQPLVPYRAEDDRGMTLEKLPPFGPDEGMPLQRPDHPKFGY
jgi:NADH-quinone oxidoreductase subunit C